MYGLALLAPTPGLGLQGQYPSYLLVSGLSCETPQESGESLGWLVGCVRCTLQTGSYFVGFSAPFAAGHVAAAVSVLVRT